MVAGRLGNIFCNRCVCCFNAIRKTTKHDDKLLVFLWWGRVPLCHLDCGYSHRCARLKRRPKSANIGLDFAIIAIFVATLPGMWRGTEDILPWLLASGIVLIWGTFFPEYASWGLIGGA